MLTAPLFSEQCDFTEDQTAGGYQTPTEVTLKERGHPLLHLCPHSNLSSLKHPQGNTSRIPFSPGASIFFSHSFFLPPLPL